MTTFQAGNKRGMTLIELMAVLGIMVVIMSAIVVAAIRLQVRGQEKGSEAFLEKLAVALEQYKGVHRIYVPQETAPDLDVDAQIQETSKPLYIALEFQSKDFETQSERKAAGGAFTTRNGAQEQWHFYRDTWNNAIVYYCVAPFTRFELRSAGRDLEFGTGDDIVRK